MAGWERERRRSRRRRAWKTAGTLLLGLMSGSLGCQGSGDHLQQHTSNDAPAILAADASSSPTISTLGQTVSQKWTNAATAVAPPAAFGPAGVDSGILQVGATKIVPLTSTTEAAPSADSFVRTAFASEERTDPSAAPETPSSTHTSDDGGASAANQKEENAERKWTSKPIVGEDKVDTKAPVAARKNQPYQVSTRLPSPTEGMAIPAIPSTDKARPLTLAAALGQAGVANPTIAIALQAVQAALGEQLQARVLLMPSVNVGANFDHHTGPVIASFGGIRKISKSLVYYGLGANTVAAETIKIPGLLISTPLVDAIFAPRHMRYVVANRRMQAAATRNNIFLDVSTTYLDLMDAETRLGIIRQSLKDFEEVARLTKVYAEQGVRRDSDARRAQADLLLLRYEELHEQQEVAIASADLAELLNLDPSTRLVTGDIPLQVVQFIDPLVQLPKLLDLAERNHPAILAASANVRASQVRVRQEISRPLLPILWMGFSAGDFGGGAVASTNGTVFNPHTGNTDLAQPIGSQGGHTIPKFGLINGRMDADVFAYWQLQNLGLGNLAIIRRQKANVGAAQAARLHVLNDVREQVSVAFNKSAEHFRAIGIQRQRVQEATSGFQKDLERIIGGEGRPIEVLDNAKRLREAREALLDAVIGFDRAQFQLFVALGQPPTLVVEDDKPPAAPPAMPVPVLGEPGAADPLPPPNALPLEKK